MKSIRIFFVISTLSLIFGFQNIYGQDEIIIPPSIKKMDYANREFTFSEVTMNGQRTTYLEVEKGATVKMKTSVSSKKNGNYCPACIVQVYWGIHDYTPVCAKSFYGYNFKKKKSKHTFRAPMKDGIYYITMGGSLEYSCKNSNDRPRCSSDYAFAVLKVGNPNMEQKITLQKTKKNGIVQLRTTVEKPGGFGDLNTLEWFFNGEKIADETKSEMALTKFGSYKAVWSNCLTSIADSVNHTSNEIAIIEKPALPEDALPEETIPEESDDIAVMIEQSDKFVLQHLIFDLNRWSITSEAVAELNKLAQIMKNKPTLKILLEGHTAIGNAKKNKVLSRA